MPFDLPRIVVDLTGTTPRALSVPSAALRPGELTRLLAYDEQPWPGYPVERCVTLADRRWAVARRTQDRTVWRLVDGNAIDRIGHPAWLLSREAWFEPDNSEPPNVPPVLGLRHVVRQAMGVGGNRKSVKVLAATIAALRHTVVGEDGVRRTPPVAVLIDPELLQSASAPARFFVYAVLAILPPSRREALRIGIGDVDPAPDRFDLVISEVVTPPEAFSVVRADDPADEGDDLVAYFVRNRLYAGDPEAVESAAHLTDGVLRPGADAWGEGVRQRIRAGVPGLSEVTPEWLERDAEGAVRGLSARIRAGAELDVRLLQQLIDVTVRTRDPRPWRAISSDRPAAERERAVFEFLAASDRMKRPRPELVEALARVMPPGSDLTTWCTALVRWAGEPGCAPTAVAALEEALVEWPNSPSRATRASVWTEVIRTLIDSAQLDLAVRALTSRLAHELADEGAGRSLVGSWLALPVERRVSDAVPFVELLAHAADAEAALNTMFRAVYDSPEEVAAVVGAWVRHRGHEGPDTVFLAIRDSDHVGVWARAVAASVPVQKRAEWLSPFVEGPFDPLWAEVEAAAPPPNPRDRLVQLKFYTDGLRALEPGARKVIRPAIEAQRWPDGELAEVAALLSDVDTASPVWLLVTAFAAPPLFYADEDLDALVQTACSNPPNNAQDRQIGVASAGGLGRATGWTATQHANWAIRLLSAHTTQRYDVDLVIELMNALALRPDGAARLDAIDSAMAALPQTHPASVRFYAVVLPRLG